LGDRGDDDHVAGVEHHGAAAARAAEERDLVGADGIEVQLGFRAAAAAEHHGDTVGAVDADAGHSVRRRRLRQPVIEGVGEDGAGGEVDHFGFTG
jgi:hypothetical protein